MKHSAVLTAILALAFSSIAPAAGEKTSLNLPCYQRILNSLFNPPIPSLKLLAKQNNLPVQIFDGEINHDFQNYVLNSSEWYDPKSVYIGVTNAPMQVDYGGGSHHYYLYAGGNKVHMGKNGKIQIHMKKPDQPIRVFEGVVFKLQTDDRLTQKLIESAKKAEGRSTVNCMQGICDILNDADVQVGKTGDQYVATPKVMAAGLLSGDVFHQGKKIPMQILASSKYEMENYASRANWSEDRRKKGLGLVMFSVGGVGVWYLVHELNGSKEPLSKPK